MSGARPPPPRQLKTLPQTLHLTVVCAWSPVVSSMLCVSHGNCFYHHPADSRWVMQSRNPLHNSSRTTSWEIQTEYQRYTKSHTCCIQKVQLASSVIERSRLLVSKSHGYEPFRHSGHKFVTRALSLASFPAFHTSSF